MGTYKGAEIMKSKFAVLGVELTPHPYIPNPSTLISYQALDRFIKAKEELRGFVSGNCPPEIRDKIFAILDRPVK